MCSDIYLTFYIFLFLRRVLHYFLFLLDVLEHGSNAVTPHTSLLSVSAATNQP